MSSRSTATIRSVLLLGLAWLTAGSPVRAADTTLDAAVLKKVKAATVHLEVALPSGDTVEGSGFFTDEPGVVLTNAHVLGMLAADSRPPVKVTVTVNSGEPTSRSLPAKLLGVDRGSDLAVLSVEGGRHRHGRRADRSGHGRGLVGDDEFQSGRRRGGQEHQGEVVGHADGAAAPRHPFSGQAVIDHCGKGLRAGGALFHRAERGSPPGPTPLIQEEAYEAVKKRWLACFPILKECRIT